MEFDMMNGVKECFSNLISRRCSELKKWIRNVFRYIDEFITENKSWLKELLSNFTLKWYEVVTNNEFQ